MAHNPKFTNLAANTKADALARQVDNGYLRIYSGTQPATADTGITSQVLLATLRFNATSAPAASGGVITYNAFTSDTDAAATGTPTWFRAYKSDGTTPVYDGAIGTSGSDLNLSVASIVQHGTVAITSGTYTESKG